MTKLSSLFMIILFSWIIISCKKNESSGEKTVITGKIENFPDGEMTLYRVYDEDSTLTTTTPIKNGVFTFEFADNEARLATIAFPDGMSALQLFTEPGQININGTKEDVAKATISGTPTNVLHEEFKKLNSNMEAKYNELMAAGNAAQELGDTKKLDSVTAAFMSMEKETNIQNLAFARKNPTSLLSAYIGLMAASSGNPDLDVEGLYAVLADPVKASFFGTRLKKIVDANSKTKIGVTAPEFEGMSPDGKIIKLSSLKGKYVLIDFWASWCGPCRQENPNVVNTYNEYKSKGFEIFGVSLDQEKEKWLSAIAQDNLQWPHVSDLKGWKSDIAGMYGVQGIPQNFLLDKDGKIIAKALRGQALKEKLKEVLN